MNDSVSSHIAQLKCVRYNTSEGMTALEEVRVVRVSG